MRKSEHLIKDVQRYQQISQLIIDSALQHASSLGVSSMHWLFTNDNDTKQLKNSKLMLRLGCQFHWQNNHYSDFEHYLSFFNSKNRKKIKRERRQVSEQNISIEIHDGHSMNAERWLHYHQFYTSTFDKKSGMATLSLAFF